MARNESYRIAEQKIEAARKSGGTELDLSNAYEAKDESMLTELPESLGQLRQLQTLNISGNQLRALPEWLGALTQLQDLDLSRNQLTALPESLGRLTQLQNLDLSGNQLPTLPESLGQLAQLKSLDLQNNQLTVLPESLAQLTQLKSFRFYNNKLRIFPNWVGKLVELKILRFGGNQIETLPKSLENLSLLREFGMGHVELGGAPAEIPECVRGFTALNLINALGCKLTTLPDWLGELVNIRELYLSNNKLSDIPNSLDRLTHLETLSLDDNPLIPELAAAYKEGLNAIKRYLRAKAEAQVVLNEAKLILIGEGEVGKSALLGALRGDDWVEKRDSTHGIEIKTVKVIDPGSGTLIMLNGWDFGGQRVYRPTHQLFFSAPAVYLVAWKPREGPQQGFVKEWIKLVKHREPEAKILVVATHGGPGARQPDIDRQEIWDLFGRETVVDFFFVDSRPDKKTGKCEGVEALKNKIAEVAASLPEMGRMVPKKWQEARKALKRIKSAHITTQRAVQVCGKHGLTEEDAKLFLTIEHRLGHLIHYAHDVTLKDIVILKPDWLATAMSFVLDDKHTREAHGLVSHERLAKLWNDGRRAKALRYSEELHPVFLKLMERYDLCYRVTGLKENDNEGTSLIAQLVPDVRPVVDLAREWPAALQTGDEQQAQICRIVDAKGQSSTAEGLFYQLIVRLHKLSLGRVDFNASIHWQRGLILDDDYNGRALLEHVGNDVHITVRAAYPGNLLAVLTREVKFLVEDFWEGLRCEVVVPCIEPCGKNLPGTGVFEVQKLIAFKRQGMTLFPCTVSGCNQLQDMACLLQNAPAARRPSIESMLADGFSEMRTRLEDLRQQNLVLDQGLRRIMSQVDDAFTGVMRTLTDEAKDGPRLFSLQPVEQTKFNPKGWVKKKFRITLWCEHTKLPLPLINKYEKEGVYEFDVTREWFAKAAPLLKILAGTLSLVLPAVASATKLALDESAYKALENQLDFGKDCAEAMLSASEKTAEWLDEKEGLELKRAGSIRANGGVLREFQAWLKEEAPGFGDLRRVQNKQQEFMWVHRNFEKEY